MILDAVPACFLGALLQLHNQECEAFLTLVFRYMVWDIV